MLPSMYWMFQVFLLFSIVTKNLFRIKSIKNQKYTLVTACDEKHFIYLKQLIYNYEKYKYFNQFIIYNLGLNTEQINFIKDLDFIDFRNFQFKDYPSHFQKRLLNHGNKIGGFAWKPAILKIVKDEAEDNIIWFDSANLFDWKFIFFKLFLLDKGFISFYSTGNIHDYTHKDVISKLNLGNDKEILTSNNLMGGVVGFNVNNEVAIKIIESWYELCLEESNIFPKNSSLKNHRHDQSILSICYWSYSKDKLPSIPNLYGVSIQNWPNKILFLFDERDSLSKELKNHFSDFTTTTDYRCKYIYLFNIENLSKIPLKLIVSKSVNIFIFNQEDFNNINKFKIKKYFVTLVYEEKLDLKLENSMKLSIENIKNLISHDLDKTMKLYK